MLGGTGEVADEKTISAVRATFEATAEENERDPQVAAAMVDTRVEIDGLVTGEELLTLTAAEAIDVGYAAAAVPDIDALLVELDLADNELVDTSPRFAEQLVRFLTSPVLAGLLLLGGLVLVLGDFFSGSLGIAALGGFALLALFFWGHMLAGLAGWEDVALVALGVMLLAVEVFVVPGFGVPGVLGLIALGAGAFMSMLSPPPDRLPPPVEIRRPEPERVRRELAPPPPARTRPAPTSKLDDRLVTRGPTTRDRLRRALATPGAARRAVLLGEVLDRPLSLRREGNSYP